MKTELHVEIQELDVVALLEDLPTLKLKKGEMGTVLLCDKTDVLLVEFEPRTDGLLHVCEVNRDAVILLHFPEKVLIST